MNTRFNPVLLRNLDPKLVDNYFQELIDSGLAKNRFPMYHPVTLKNISRYMSDCYNLPMLVIDSETQSICGEITLNMFQGRAAFAHFSVHPDYKSKEFLFGFQEVLDILCDSVELRTLIAWIPATNMLANNFIKRIGFKFQCEVDNAYYIKQTDQYVPAFQSIYNKED